MLPCSLNVPVERLTADTQFMSESRLRLSRGNTPAKFLCLRRIQGVLPAGVRPFPQLRQGNPLTLQLADQVALELRKGSTTLRNRCDIGESSPVKVRFSFSNRTWTPRSVNPRTHLAQIVEVSGPPVHRMTDNGIPFPNVACELFELRTLQILAGDFIYEALIERYAFQLPHFLLVQRADPQVADHLTGFPLSFCRIRF